MDEDAMTRTKRSVTEDAGRPGPPGFRSLLVPIDLTPLSDRIVGRTSLLPMAHDARVTLLHVVPGGLPMRDQLNAERDANKVLADEARHLRTSLPRNAIIEPMLKIGAAAAVIGACATRVKAELIVMGRGAGRALRETFLGSTAERVIRRARLPVLVVRLPSRTAYRRPALALDLDQSVHEAVRLMLRALPSPRPQVTVIHAFDVGYRRHVYPSLTGDESEELKDELQVRATRKLGRLLATSLAKAHLPPTEAPHWKTHVRYGSPGIVVGRAMRKIGTDLLVLGTRGHTGAAYLFVGSVAGALLREARCDVLIVPPAPSRE